jgi:hypothetical protein
MDASFIDTLINRRDELRKELVHIEELIKIHQGVSVTAKPESSSKPTMVRTKFNKRRTNVKSQILSLIKGFGDEFYVVDLVKAMEVKEPNKDHKLISNKARNYIHILKKEGIISGRLVENNKYVYKMTNK